MARLPVTQLESYAACGHYGDCGCTEPVIANCCFRCPLSKCRYEGGSRVVVNESRNRELRALAARGTPVAVLALRFGLHKRTVYKLLEVPNGT